MITQLIWSIWTLISCFEEGLITLITHSLLKKRAANLQMIIFDDDDDEWRLTYGKLIQLRLLKALGKKLRKVTLTFECNFINDNLFVSIFFFAEDCSLRCDLLEVIIGLDNGLARHRCEVIIWTKDDHIQEHIHVALGGGDSIYTVYIQTMPLFSTRQETCNFVLYSDCGLVTKIILFSKWCFSVGVWKIF